MISSHTWNEIYRITLTVLPYYRVQYEQVQFCKKIALFYLFSCNEKDDTVIWIGFC